MAGRSERIERSITNWTRSAAVVICTLYALIQSPLSQSIELMMFVGLTALANMWRGSAREGRPARRRFGALAVALSIGLTTWGQVRVTEIVLTVAAIGLLPLLLSLAFGLIALSAWDEEQVAGGGSWLLFLAVRRYLWSALVAAIWFMADTSFADHRPTLTGTIPAFACAKRHPLVAAGLLLVALPVSGPTTIWCSTALLTTVLAVSRVPPRPPRRTVTLVPSGVGATHPILFWRVTGLQRALERSRWSDAAQRVHNLLAHRIPEGPRESLAIRRAFALLQLGETQRAIDDLTPVRASHDTQRKAVAWRVHADCLLASDQLDDALWAYAFSRSLLPADTQHLASIALGEASVLVLRDPALAFESALAAANHFRDASELVERLQATRLLAESCVARGDLAGANKSLAAAMGPVASVRWLRQYLSAAGHHRSDERALFSTGVPILLELLRVNVLQARLNLDPRAEESVPHEVVNSLAESALSFRLMGSSLDAAEVELTLSELQAQAGDPTNALKLALSAITDLDHVRYELRSQRARSLWFNRFSIALERGLELSDRIGRGEQVAELIELARMQAVPVANETATATDLSLAPPPTVRVRGHAAIVRPPAGGPPIDLEIAAVSAAGPGAWWLSYWSTGPSLYWAVVPPAGSVSHGRIPTSPGTPCHVALRDLLDALPVLQADEDDAELDFRVGRGALASDPAAEAQLSHRLGSLLIPPPLRAELIRRARENLDALPLAIAPSPNLGRVPWSILIVRDDGADETDLRLVEVARWTLAASATLLARRTTPQPERSRNPLRVAIFDPIDAPPEFAELPAARSLAARLPVSVDVLGGGHWSAHVATRDRVLRALATAGRDASVVWGCHAVVGQLGQPSTSALVIAGSDGSPDFLTAADLIRHGHQSASFPRQVSLQACDTSDLAGSAAGEWLTLAPAFLAAGAQTVVTTLFPLLDVDDDPMGTALIDAMIDGDDLGVAMRDAQLLALATWRRHAEPGSRAPLHDSPLVWASFAECSAGKVGSATDQRQVHISARLYRALAEAACVAKDVHADVVTTAHFVAGYITTETEILDVSLLRATAGTAGIIALSKLARERASSATTASGRRPSVKLMDAVRSATDKAALSGGAVEPEHVLQAVMADADSAGSRLLRRSRVARLPAFHGTLVANLRESMLSPLVRAPTEAAAFGEEIVREELHRRGATRSSQPAGIERAVQNEDD